MPREGDCCHWLARIVSLWTGTAQIEAPASEANDAGEGLTQRRNRAMRKRVDVQPGVEDRRIRQYTKAGGAPVVENPEAIEFEARLGGCSAGGELAAHREGVGRRP